MIAAARLAPGSVQVASPKEDPTRRLSLRLRVSQSRPDSESSSYTLPPLPLAVASPSLPEAYSSASGLTALIHLPVMTSTVQSQLGGTMAVVLHDVNHGTMCESTISR